MFANLPLTKASATADSDSRGRETDSVHQNMAGMGTDKGRICSPFYNLPEFPFPAGIKVYLLSEDNKTRKVLVLLLLPGHGIKFKDTMITL